MERLAQALGRKLKLALIFACIGIAPSVFSTVATADLDQSRCTPDLIGISRKLQKSGLFVPQKVQRYLLKFKISGAQLDQLFQEKMDYNWQLPKQNTGEVEHYWFLSTVDLGKTTYQIFVSENIWTGEKTIEGIYKTYDLKLMREYYRAAVKNEDGTLAQPKSFGLAETFQTSVYKGVGFTRLLVGSALGFKLFGKHQIDEALTQKIANSISSKRVFLLWKSDVDEKPRAEFMTFAVIDGVVYKVGFYAYPQSRELGLKYAYPVNTTKKSVERLYQSRYWPVEVVK